MNNFEGHLIFRNDRIKQALILLDEQGFDCAILFVVDSKNKLLGSLTDGDVRRGLINGHSINDKVIKICQLKPKFIVKEKYDLDNLIKFRDNLFKMIPVVDSDHHVVNVINLGKLKSYLPVDAVIMAGGKGQRLMPLTEHIPKPLLKVGGKPIIEHNLDRLMLYGIDDFWISVNYLGNQIESYFGNGEAQNVQISYVREDQPLGTIGAVSKIDNFQHDYILITNSDILTNLDYEKFFLNFLEEDADLSVITIPYKVNVPYAVLEIENRRVISFIEKPTYNYFSNGGIYLAKRSVLKLVPKKSYFNATDLIQKLISIGKRVSSYPLMDYWLDIGNPQDYEKAENDIKNIKF